MTGHEGRHALHQISGFKQIEIAMHGGLGELRVACQFGLVQHLPRTQRGKLHHTAKVRQRINL